MWPLNDEIPLIKNISENEENIIEITHSKGQFKINKKEIVDVQMKSDIHSLKSNPYYSDEHAFIVLSDFYRTWFPFIGAFSLNMIRAIISLGIAGGVSFFLLRLIIVSDIFFINSNAGFGLATLLILIILIWIAIDKTIRSFIFPTIIKLLFSDFIKKDIFVIKTTGNTFEFRESNGFSWLSSAGDLLPLLKDSDESLRIRNIKRKILYVLFYSLIFINFLFLLVIFSSFVKIHDSLNLYFFYIGFFGIILLVSMPIIVVTILKILVGSMLILFLLPPGISVVGGVLLAILPEIIYRKYQSSDKEMFLARESTSKWRGRLIVFFLFLLGILYYFVFENIVYLPIYSWSKTIDPFWYFIYFDFYVYLFIISMFSMLSLYPIAYVLDNLIKKKDQNLSE